MLVLGLAFTDHEASAALVVDGTLTVGIARERLTRLKKDGKSWGSKRLDLSCAIRYCLDTARASLNDVDLLVWNHIDHISKEQIFERLATEGSLDLSGIQSISLPHHFAHACCAFYLSGFSEAAVLVADGLGGPLDGLKHRCEGPESCAVNQGQTLVQNLRDDGSESAREHESFYYCHHGEWQSLRKIVGNWHGIGAEYASVSDFLFGDCLHAGKTMGLAPYGKRHHKPLCLEAIDLQNLTVLKSTRSSERILLESNIGSLRESVIDYVTPEPSMLAASVQVEAEEGLLVHARWLRMRTQSRNLCLSGGVALNCVANSRLAREAGFERVYVPPAPGDDGIAIGCALYGAAQIDQLKQVDFPVFLGRSYLHDAKEFERLGVIHDSACENVYDGAAERLSQGSVVAWYQGGSEMGPRALGHRSFLADPRDANIRDYLNRVVKNRELFRPFAPVVLAEAVTEYFEECHPSYYMSFVARVRTEKQSIVPAITHVDGTARYQVLQRQDNPELHKLISAFAALTGIPLLLNTSFNRAGEPIVETPLEAVQCMLAASVNYLIVDGQAYYRAASRS